MTRNKKSLRDVKRINRELKKPREREWSSCSEDEATRMVADACGYASIGIRLVRILRHLGSSPRRFLANHKYIFLLVYSFNQFHLLIYCVFDVGSIHCMFIKLVEANPFQHWLNESIHFSGFVF